MTTYFNATSFVFKIGKRVLGILPFATLTLDFRECTEDEKILLECTAEEYQAGEAIQFGDNTIVLGPKRDFTHEVRLHSVGNPDHGQYADTGLRKTVLICSIEEAQKLVRDYQERYNMGGGNCAMNHGAVYLLPTKPGGKKRKIGRVGYNGHFWTVAADKAAKLEFEAKIKALKAAH